MAKQMHRKNQQIEAEMRQIHKVSEAFLAVIDSHVEHADDRRSAAENVVNRQIGALYSFDQWNRSAVPTQHALAAHVTAEVFALCEGRDRYQRGDLEAVVTAIATKLVRHSYRVDSTGIVTIERPDPAEAAA
ncbi:hypothetical protein [Nocardia brasiliensis]|uniref:hypothetical protein n=1 Tax=Nocardia brasiliensis TaxID=37326 RepID=UPI00245822AE|nr:hypothetical protein [Nocardia brasiliensis]